MGIKNNFIQKIFILRVKQYYWHELRFGHDFELLA